MDPFQREKQPAEKEATPQKQPKAREKMIRSQLMGSHSHATLDGPQVHVWKRGTNFIARGRIDGVSFGESLGNDEVEAAARLRQILTEIENGVYRRPSEKTRRVLSRIGSTRLTLRELIDAFLAAKRSEKGLQTAQDYKSRLMPVLRFAEQPVQIRRWSYARDVNKEFVREFRAFLIQQQTSRNGRPGGKPKSFSHRQIVNILGCLRTMFAWASNPESRRLPADWLNPVTNDLVGTVPAKDPFRDDKVPLDLRIRIAAAMDQWQLCQIGPSLVLPMRPDEVAGLLVGDFKFDRGWLEFGHQFDDVNTTKEGTTFRLPLPKELLPIMAACVAGRTEGPLMRSRRAFQKNEIDRLRSAAELRERYEELLQQQARGRVQTHHDRKRLFRSLLRKLGGISEDAMNVEFKKILAALGVNNGATIYSLRASITTSMNRANLPHLEMRYLTSHSINDILNEYATLDPVNAIQPYFEYVQPLLTTLSDRARQLGLPAA